MSLLLSQPRIDRNAPTIITAVFDPPTVCPGEESVYRITINALEESIDMPSKLPLPPQLGATPGAHGQILHMAGPQLLPETSFNFHVRPTAVGEFTIPALEVGVYGQQRTVPAATLAVVPALGPGHLTAQRLSIECPLTNVYVGQATPIRVLLSSLIGVQVLSQVQLEGDGFLADAGAARQRIEPRAHGGTNLLTYIYETDIVPIRAGKLSVFAQGYTLFRQAPLPGAIPGAQRANPLPQYVLLDSDPIELTVQPLPTNGELPGFTGAIGQFTLGPSLLSADDLQVGEPTKLLVAIRGQGDLARLVAPPPPMLKDWQVFPATKEALPPQVARGAAAFSYTLIPLNPRSKETPRIPFSYFDPELGAYRDLSFPPLPVSVKPSAVAADVQALLEPVHNPGESEKEPVLSDIVHSRGVVAASLAPVQSRAWFPFVQLAPGVCLLLLWLWDRRRRYFEQHPGVVLRRRARRALRKARRSLRHAARARNDSRFITAAVDALRIASAPNYPAEPRALVSRDVLALIVQEPGNGKTREAVERVFAADNIARFSGAAGQNRGISDTYGEIDQVLGRLDEKLRSDETNGGDSPADIPPRDGALDRSRPVAAQAGLLVLLIGLLARAASASSSEAYSTPAPWPINPAIMTWPLWLSTTRPRWSRPPGRCRTSAMRNGNPAIQERLFLPGSNRSGWTCTAALSIRT